MFVLDPQRALALLTGPPFVVLQKSRLPLLCLLLLLQPVVLRSTRPQLQQEHDALIQKNVSRRSGLVAAAAAAAAAVVVRVVSCVPQPVVTLSSPPLLPTLVVLVPPPHHQGPSPRPSS